VPTHGRSRSTNLADEGFWCSCTGRGPYHAGASCLFGHNHGIRHPCMYARSRTTFVRHGMAHARRGFASCARLRLLHDLWHARRLFLLWHSCHGPRQPSLPRRSAAWAACALSEVRTDGSSCQAPAKASGFPVSPEPGHAPKTSRGTACSTPRAHFSGRVPPDHEYPRFDMQVFAVLCRFAEPVKRTACSRNRNFRSGALLLSRPALSFLWLGRPFFSP